MKSVINTILRTGWSTTQKYCVADLPYFLRPICEDMESGIKCNGNPFWRFENKENRSALIRDMQGYSKSIQKGTTFEIINRYENGDAYGIDKEFVKCNDVEKLISNAVMVSEAVNDGKEVVKDAEVEK